MIKQNKVLIIDDEPAIRELLGAWFGRYNFSTETAENPETAMECILLNEYSVIVIDFTMPVLNGSEFIKRIRSMGCKTQIIGMSAQTYVRDLFYRAGADYFVEKPIDFKRLSSIIYRLQLMDDRTGK